jgi:hypothetical protein
MLRETLRHAAAFLGIALLFGGFIALLAWDHAAGQARCPGYYNDAYGCSAPLSGGAR